MSINSPEWSDGKPATQPKAENESVASNDEDSLERQREARDTNVIGIVEAERQGPEPGSSVFG